jgi:hypothetical protein
VDGYVGLEGGSGQRDWGDGAITTSTKEPFSGNHRGRLGQVREKVLFATGGIWITFFMRLRNEKSFDLGGHYIELLRPVCLLG